MPQETGGDGTGSIVGCARIPSCTAQPAVTILGASLPVKLGSPHASSHRFGAEHGPTGNTKSGERLRDGRGTPPPPEPSGAAWGDRPFLPVN